VPKIMETNRYCSTCGNCLKACPNDAISIRLRPPGREFVTQKKEVLEQLDKANTSLRAGLGKWQEVELDQ